MAEALVLCFGLLFCVAFFVFVFETVKKGMKPTKKTQKASIAQSSLSTVSPAAVHGDEQGRSGSLAYESTEGKELHEAGFHGEQADEKNNGVYLSRSRPSTKALTPQQLREAFVLNEILSPPLSRRGQKRRTW